MVERPRTFLLTKETASTSYVDVISNKISDNAEGISFLSMSIDPDPNALYRIAIARMLNEAELEITAIWTLELPHLTSGVYEGFRAGDTILIQHRSIDAAITVKTGITLAFNEVVKPYGK